MPDEKELRDLLASADAPNSLDPAVVIRRAKRRRLPQQVAAGAVGVLAVAGIGVLAVNLSSLSSPLATTSDQSALSDEAADAPSDEFLTQKRLGADAINVCGAVPAAPEPSRYGLELTVDFPDVAPANAAAVDGQVTMTNTSAEIVSGMTAIAPTVAVIQDDLVVALSGPAEYAVQMIDLAPGQSVEYATSFSPVQCSADGDAGDNAPLEAGDYELTALVDFTPAELGADEPALADLVSGPRSQLTLQ